MTTIPAWRTGDLVSASKLNAMLDEIDVLIGLDEQRVYPFDAGADINRCTVYGRPPLGYNKGTQVEYWLAHNGDRLVVKHSGDDGAYLFWNWDGVSYNNPIALVPSGVQTTIALPTAGLYQYQPVRFMLRSQGGNETAFVDYVYQTDSNAPAISGLPAFTNGTASNAADLNAILAGIDAGSANLLQPIPCQYSNNDRVGTRNHWIGYIRHTHDKLFLDVTASGLEPGDYWFLRYNDTDVPLSPAGTSDGLVTGDAPAGLTKGNWYRVHIGVNREAEHEQYLRVWSFYEAPAEVSTAFFTAQRWAHGDVLNGSSGSEGYGLAAMTGALTAINNRLRWINQPCRVAGSIVLGVGFDQCNGAQILDGMSSHRVHRWLAYNAFRKLDGSYMTPTLQWQTGRRNVQTYTLPVIDNETGYAFFDMESTPIKPGMWFGLIGAGFGIQTPAPGFNYA